MADANTQVLIKRLMVRDEPMPDAQWQAAIALGDGPASDEVVAALIDALGAGHGALTRAHAAEALGKLTAKAAMATLVGALKDPYRLARSYAVRSLGKLRDESTIPPLLDAMRNDEFFGVRAEAAEALGAICEGSESEACRGVRRALIVQKAEEQARRQRGVEEGRSVRVQGEVDRALERLKALLDKAEQVSGQLEAAIQRNDLRSASRYAADLRATLAEAQRQRLTFGMAAGPV